MTDIKTAFYDAIQKVKADYEKGIVKQADIERLKIWGEFAKTKVEAERELNARAIDTCDSINDRRHTDSD